MKELNAIRLMRIKQDIQDEAAYLGSGSPKTLPT